MAVARGRMFARTDVLGVGPDTGPSTWGAQQQPRRGGYQDFQNTRMPPQTYQTAPLGGGLGAGSELNMVTDSLQRIQQTYNQAHTLDNGDFGMLGTGGVSGGLMTTTNSYKPSFGNNPSQQAPLTGNFVPQPVGGRRGRAHVSMTADQLPDPRDVKAQRDRELQEQIALRRAMQEQQQRQAREQEDLLERRARAQQEKMQQEYDEEMARKKAKDDARNARAEKLRQRVEQGQWNTTNPTTAAKPGAAPAASKLEGTKPASGSSLNDMDRDFLGLKPPGSLGLIAPSASGGGGLLGPSGSTGASLISPSPITVPSAMTPNLMPGVGAGALDLGPEPGSEFLIQKAREMGISIPSDDLPRPGPVSSTLDQNLGLMTKSYSDPSLAANFGAVGTSAPLSTGFTSSAEAPHMSMADPGFMMSEPPHMFLEPDPLLRGLKTM